MNTIVEQTETTEISFGDKLRQTREALNLSLEDVAKAISLRPSILAKLENNEFVQKDVPSTFLRGYPIFFSQPLGRHTHNNYFTRCCWNDWLMVVAKLSKIKRRT